MAERKNYSDEFLWCEDCGQTNKGPCEVHGALNCVKDRSIPSRARLTLPHHLTIKTLELRAASKHVYGVFAKKMLQSRTQFGPVEGERRNVTEDGEESPEHSTIKLRIFDSELHWTKLICQDDNICNWMMFVRPARTFQEQNLIAYQYKGALYYATTKHVAPGSELRVWYGAEYADLMGIPLLPGSESNNRKKEQLKSPSKENLSDEEKSTSCGNESVLDNLFQSEEDGTSEDQATINAALQEADYYEQDDPLKDANEAVTYVQMKVHQQNLHVQESENSAVMLNGVQAPNRCCSQCHQPFPDARSHLVHQCKTTNPERNNSVHSQTDNHHDNANHVDQSDRAIPDSGYNHQGQGRPGDLQPDLDHCQRDADEGEGRRTKSKRKGTPKKVPAAPHITKAKKERKSSKLFGIQKVAVKKERGRPRLERKTQEGADALLHCTDCEKVFVKEAKLKAHMYVHTGERPFKCSAPNCSKAFICKFKLGRHELVHSQRRDFACDYCGKAFARKDHLQIHLKSHDPEKSKYICETCGREYQSIQGYKTHRAFHAAENGDLTCGVCNKKFTLKEDLLHHLKIHTGARSAKWDTGEKKFMCTFCDKGFYTAKDMRRHAVVHTKVKEFLCQFCPQRFGRRDHLVRHLRRTHKTEISNTPRELSIDSSPNHQVDKNVSSKSDLSKLDKLQIDFPMKHLDLDYLTETTHIANEHLYVKKLDTLNNEVKMKEKMILDQKEAILDSLLQRVMFNQAPLEIGNDHHEYIHNSTLGHINLSGSSAVNMNPATNITAGLPVMNSSDITQYGLDLNSSRTPRHMPFHLHELQNTYQQNSGNFPSSLLTAHEDLGLTAAPLMSTGTRENTFQ